MPAPDPIHAVHLRLHGSMLVQQGRLIFLTSMKASEVVRHAHVDVFDAETNEGYQRTLVKARARAAANYYEEGGRMPNPLLFNIRKDDFDIVRVEVTHDRSGFDNARAEDGEWNGAAVLDMPPELRMWLYDGQHRGGALEILVEKRSEFGDFPVPLSITLGLSATEEMKEFLEVNSNAKSVKTDLAWEILRRQAASDPELAEALEVKGMDWIVVGQEVVTKLRQMEGPWKESIQAANEQKGKYDRLVVTQSQFVRSLKPVLEMPLLAKADPATIAKIVNAYWIGMSKVLPSPFTTTTNPKKWVIQKGTGAVVFHGLLPGVLEVLRSRGQPLGNPSAYADVLSGLPRLSGEIVTEDGRTEEVTGPEFWRSGPAGVASQFNGASGRKRLEMIVRTVLPKPATEIRL